MTTEKTNTNEKNKEKKEFGRFSFIYLCGLFLAQAGLYTLLFFMFYNPDEFPSTNALYSLYLVFAFINMVTFSGILLKRHYGKILIALVAPMGMIVSLSYPLFALFLIPITFIGLYLFRDNALAFKPKDKKDKYAYIAIALALILFLANAEYSQNLPRPEPYYSKVTKEAIQKNDVTICNRINSGYRDDCIKAYAVYKNDSNFCALIQWEHLRGYCYGELNSNET